jgi:hypothetical protein
MTRKHLTIAAALAALSITGCSAGEPKYKRGDCITPTDSTYSWYGEYARVEGWGKFTGAWEGEWNYSLWFPHYRSGATLFAKSIEDDTKEVRRSMCIRREEDQ